MTSVVEETTVSWRRVQGSEDIYYESGTDDYLLLNLNRSMTGLLEITVIFSSGDCEKSSIKTEYFGKMSK